MKFRTEVKIPRAEFAIEPHHRLLFVGSCFADNIGKRFVEDKFNAVVNPYGVMYNPESVRSSLERYFKEMAIGRDSLPDIVVVTLGTNHVYRDKVTQRIVDNCKKQPAYYFEEEDLDLESCVSSLFWVMNIVETFAPSARVIFTVSPIRYAKYGYHESQLAKATLLLAADTIVKKDPEKAFYFPAYEIINDELRDYRFYAPDMLHPSEQAVDYIYSRFRETYFSKACHTFVDDWRPLKAAYAHRPFNPDSDEYQDFLEETNIKYEAFKKKYPFVED